MSTGNTAVLLMSFGGPESLAEVPAFVTSVLGRTPPAHLEKEITERYRSLGGKSPLPEVTRRQAESLQAELLRRGCDWPVLVGMQHARPTLEEAIEDLAGLEVDSVVALSLAPYRSRASTTAYEQTVMGLVEKKGLSVRVIFPEDWFIQPTYIQALADRLARTLDEVPAHLRMGIPVIFSAHSLPVRFVEEGDPYVRQLEETIRAVVSRLQGVDARLGFQSVSGAAREPWVGPDVIDLMTELKEKGAEALVVDPIGFVTDHLETLYDNDILHKAHADELDLQFFRCRCLNTDPRFIEALAEITLGAGKA